MYRKSWIEMSAQSIDYFYRKVRHCIMNTHTHIFVVLRFLESDYFWFFSWVVSFTKESFSYKTTSAFWRFHCFHLFSSPFTSRNFHSLSLSLSLSVCLQALPFYSLLHPFSISHSSFLYLYILSSFSLSTFSITLFRLLFLISFSSSFFALSPSISFSLYPVLPSSSHDHSFLLSSAVAVFFSSFLQVFSFPSQQFPLIILALSYFTFFSFHVIFFFSVRFSLSISLIWPSGCSDFFFFHHYYYYIDH